MASVPLRTFAGAICIPSGGVIGGAAGGDGISAGGIGISVGTDGVGGAVCAASAAAVVSKMIENALFANKVSTVIAISLSGVFGAEHRHGGSAPLAPIQPTNGSFVPA